MLSLSSDVGSVNNIYMLSVLMSKAIVEILPPTVVANIRSAGTIGALIFQECVASSRVPMYIHMTSFEIPSSSALLQDNSNGTQNGNVGVVSAVAEEAPAPVDPLPSAAMVTYQSYEETDSHLHDLLELVPCGGNGPVCPFDVVFNM